MPRLSLKPALYTTTALIGAAMIGMSVASPAQADILVDNTNRVTTAALGAGETLLVTSTGTITADPGVTVNNVIANSITNAGTIYSSNVAGIRLQNNGTLTNGLTNGGTITGNTIGIHIISNSTLAGGLTNSGLITSGGGTTRYAISLVNSALAGGLINTGTINGAAGAIGLFGGGISGGINNSGTIAGNIQGAFFFSSIITDGLTNTGTMTGNSAGFYLQNNSSLSGGLTNGGVISSIVVDTIALFNTSAVFTSFAPSQLTGGLINNGTINGSGFFIKGGSLQDGLTNAGLINGSVEGIALTPVLASSGSYVQAATLTGGITNSGTIDGGSIGIYLAYIASLTGGLTNSGTIDGGSIGIDLYNNANLSNGLTNSGKIGGSGIGIRLTNTSILAGGLTNSGTIIGGISIDGSSTAPSLMLNGGRIIGNVIDDNAGAGNSVTTITDDFATEGDFSVSSLTLDTTKTLTLSNGDSFTLDSAATINGTLAFNVAGDADFGSLIVTNGAANLTNASFSVMVDNGAVFTNGAELLVVNGSIALVGGPGSTPTTVTDNSAYWNFLLVDGIGAVANTGNSDLYLQVVRVNPIVINSAVTDQLVLIDDDAVDVTNAGSLIVTSGNAITIDNITADIITNDGTISAADNGIVITNGGIIDMIINNGFIAGLLTAGLRMSSGASITGGLTNSGTIEGVDQSLFIQDQATIDGGLVNSGTFSGAINGIYFTSNALLTGGLTNSGTIGGSNRALQVQNAATIIGGLTNSGTISGGRAGISLISNANLSDGLTNSGIINGDVSYGISIFNNSTLSGGLTNSGAISGNDSSARGINLGNSSTLIGGLANSGIISGGSFGIYLESNSILSGGLTNSGTIDGGIAIDTASLVDSIVLNAGRIIGDVIDATPISGSDIIVDGTFTTEGNFDVSSLTVNNARTLTISSGNTFTSYNDAVINGTLSFEIVDTAHYGSLIITDGAADLTNATITISAASATLANGDEIRIINGDDAIIGGPGATKTLVTDNSFLWDFRMFDGTAAATATDNTDLFVEAMQVSTSEQAATTPNNQSVAVVIDSLGGTPDPQLQQIIANLNNAPTQQAVNDILESVTPTIDTAVSDATSAIAHQSVDMINARLSDLRAGSGISSGHLTDSLAIWGQVFGQHASQSKRDNIAGYSANTYGFVGGIDTDHLFDNATIGLALSYGSSAIKSKDANSTRTDINSYQIGLYGDYNLPQDYFISGSASYGYNDIQSVRRDVGGIAGLTATGDYSAEQYTAHIETGKDFQIKQAYAPTITPTIGATYTHLSPDSYTETGAGGANLTVETDTIESLELGAAIKSQWDINQTDGSVLSPSLHAGYRYDIIGDTIQSTSNFTGGGASFNTQGADPARGTATIGAGLQYQATSNWTLSAGYDFEIRQDYTAHAGILRAGYAF